MIPPPTRRTAELHEGNCLAWKTHSSLGSEATLQPKEGSHTVSSHHELGAVTHNLTRFQEIR